MRRSPVGVSLSWLIIILLLPFVGVGIYLIVGENRLGSRRARDSIALDNAYAGWRSDLLDRAPHSWEDWPPGSEAVHRQALRASGLPGLPGNRLELINDTQDALQRLITDIDQAKDRCHLEFYIWQLGGRIDELCNALLRAAKRGVHCRCLADAVGSKAFLTNHAEIKALRDAGVEIVAALPASLLRAVFQRIDLRNHRKLAVIDGTIAYTGSLNLIDPRYFKQDAGVGEWIDAMVRIQGPAVEPMAMTFLRDWQLETGQDLKQIDRRRPEAGIDYPHQPEDARVQLVPSGPRLRADSIHRLLIAAIYAAQKSIVVTTPYFVPDEALLIALTSAAARGVDTLIIMPKRNDSFLVRHASNAYLGELLAAGVKVACFDGGLLHTKSVTIDDHLSTFGTVNLDMRSFYLNFELTLFVYDKAFTRELRTLQQTYLVNSNMANLEAWKNQPFGRRLVDNIARLLGPLL